jgi:hypothetical protein
MPIASTDLKLYASTSGLGGAITATEIVSGTLNALFDDVTEGEATAGDIEYRGFYVKNTNGSLTWSSPVIYISSLTSNASTEFDLAIAAEGVSVTMATIANESTAPGGVSFSRPTTQGAGLSLGSLAPGAYRGVWIKRTVTAGAASSTDVGTLTAIGSSPP